jgi:hypothetical protein
MVSSDVGGHPGWNLRAMKARGYRREGLINPSKPVVCAYVFFFTISRQVGTVVRTFRVRER